MNNSDTKTISAALLYVRKQPNKLIKIMTSFKLPFKLGMQYKPRHAIIPPNAFGPPACKPLILPSVNIQLLLLNPIFQ